MEGSGSFYAAFLKGTVVGEKPCTPLPPVKGDPTRLYEDFLPEEVLKSPGRKAWFIVPDSLGLIRWPWREDKQQGYHLLILAARRTPPEYLAFLRRKTIPYLIAARSGWISLWP